MRVFIGHGGSPAWRELKDFLHDRLHLDWEEFNRVSAAGLWTGDRLNTMLSNSSMAFLIFTAEDEHADGSNHARENVIHEAGLFQGRLGFPRAIVLLEDGCEEFSNIHGLGQIRFPRGNMAAKFEEIRSVLERERLIPPA
jgi:predicted nucleotide-binding protein